MQLLEDLILSSAGFKLKDPTDLRKYLRQAIVNLRAKQTDNATTGGDATSCIQLGLGTERAGIYVGALDENLGAYFANKFPEWATSDAGYRKQTYVGLNCFPYPGLDQGFHSIGGSSAQMYVTLFLFSFIGSVLVLRARRASGVSYIRPEDWVFGAYYNWGDTVADSTVKVGATIFYPASRVTDTTLGALACNGAEVSRETYSYLFNVIGESYGAGDGSTTFNVPSLAQIGITSPPDSKYGTWCIKYM